LGSEGKLADYGAAAFDDRLGELAMLRRIDDIDTASHDSDSSASAVEGSLMRRAIDSSREAAYDREAFGGQLHPQAMGHSQAGLARGTRAHDCEASLVVQSSRSSNEKVGWRIRNLSKIGRVVLVGPFQQARAEPRQLAQLLFEGLKVAELLDASGCRARHPGRHDFGFIEAEDDLGGTILLEQETASPRSNSSDAPQRQPICIGSGHLYSLIC
jgi:surface antigen